MNSSGQEFRGRHQAQLDPIGAVGFLVFPLVFKIIRKLPGVEPESKSALELKANSHHRFARERGTAMLSILD